MTARLQARERMRPRLGRRQQREDKGAQKQTPVDDPHAEVEIKPQLKPRGSVAKEKDTKPSHQLHKLQIMV